MAAKNHSKNRQLQQRLKTMLQPAAWFALVASAFGIVFVFATAPMNVPDETNHFLRAWQISEGHFLPEKQHNETGGTMPVSVINFEGMALAQPDHRSDPWALKNIRVDDERAFIRFENTSLYSPIAYAPQALGITIGRAFDLPVLYSLYLARLLNVAAYILLVYWAVRLLPFGKWAAVAIGLLPMHLVLAGSLSSDGIATGLLFLMVGVVLRLRTWQHALNNVQLGLLLLLTVAVSLIKPPFQLALLLFLLLPRTLFKTVLRQWLFYGVAFVLAALAGGSWLITAKSLSSDYGPELANDSKQLEFILSHPIDFATAMFKTYFTSYGNGFYNQYVLSVGWLETWLPYWVTFAYTALLAMVLWPIRAVEALTRRQKLFVLGVLSLSFLAISLLIYLSWSPVGNNRIDGIQMRYFTPLAILCIPIFAVRSSKHNTSDGALPPWVFRLAPVVFLALSLMLILNWTYSTGTLLT